jgi:ATP-dependent Lon protease
MYYEMPLWDKVSQDMIVPLPSSHLPDELTTCSIYGVQIQTPLERIIIEQATAAAAAASSKQYFGVAFSSDSLNDKAEDIQVGSIGCACQILIHDENNQVVICRGAFRFIVKDIIQRIPFAIVQVEELPDNPVDEEEDDTLTSATTIQTPHDEDDDDDEDDEDDNDYAQLSPDESMQRTLLAVKSCIDRKIQETSSSSLSSSSSSGLSPLEEAILQDSGTLTDYHLAESAQRQAAQENAAVLEVFQSLLADDDFETPQQRWFAVAFLAAELCDFDAADRIQILRCTNTLERLRFVCQVAERIVGFQYAQSIANSITDSVDESSKELKVGTPDLPPWVRQIRKGMHLEYFWNPEHGWCRGVVVQEPVLMEENDSNGKEVMAKMMLCVQFEDDGTTHWLPVLPDEKARWRPA